MEMGCGFGILLKFLKEIKPEADFMGIDYASNLVKIGRELTDIDLIDGSYLDLKPTYNMIQLFVILDLIWTI